MSLAAGDPLLVAGAWRVPGVASRRRTASLSREAGVRLIYAASLYWQASRFVGNGTITAPRLEFAAFHARAPRQSYERSQPFAAARMRMIILAINSRMVGSASTITSPIAASAINIPVHKRQDRCFAIRLIYV